MPFTNSGLGLSGLNVHQIELTYDENLRTGFKDMNIVGLDLVDLDLNAHSPSSLPQENETAGDCQ